MNIHTELFESFDHVDQCEECPHPNGCLRECIIKKFKYEDVAKIRGEGKE